MSSELFSLKGKTILVTGASSGIGREVCRVVSTTGGSVVATGRNEETLAETVEQLEGNGHRTIVADLIDEAQREAMVDQLEEIDGVVHSAGIVRVIPIRYTKKKPLREMFELNAEVPILLTRYLLAKRRIKDGGSIVYVSSLSAFMGMAGHVSYAASKAALLAASRVLAIELAGKRIRSNCICPAMVRTPMLDGDLSKEQLQKHEQAYPLGFGEPLDVASSVVFLLTEASRWLTGQAIILDGGVSLK